MVSDKEPIRSYEYWLAYSFLKLFHRFKVEGKENIPKEGGLVIVSNHTSYYDPPAVGAAIFPRRAYYMAKSELFKNRIAAWFIRRYGAFPVKREKIDKGALKESISILKKKKAICMFPEGARQRGSKNDVQAVFQGAAFLAFKTQSQILPVRLKGTDRIMPPKSIFPRLARITVVIGEPFMIRSKDDIEGFSDKIMEDIYKLGAKDRS